MSEQTPLGAAVEPAARPTLVRAEVATTGPETGPTTGPTAADVPRCSAKGCRAEASTDLQWRNPRLHDAARVKHWLACDEHADSLADFLSRRTFLLSRTPL